MPLEEVETVILFMIMIIIVIIMVFDQKLDNFPLSFSPPLLPPYRSGYVVSTDSFFLSYILEYLSYPAAKLDKTVT